MLQRLIGKEIRLRVDLQPSLDLVRADTGQLRQVLLNLIVNARDAMPDGGSLIVSTSNRELNEKEARILSAPVGKFVQLKVADTGGGMTQEVRNHLFEPFYTTKEQGKGTGLGLSTVYGIIRQNDGFIEVESELGKGSIFRILLPAQTPGIPQP
jgi:signal transduction histidine kinase